MIHPALSVERRSGWDRRAPGALWNDQHQTVVEAGGGVYVPGLCLGLIMFNSPQTGTTLMLDPEQLTAERVAEKILESNKKFGVN